jgi:hypothetical protein
VLGDDVSGEQINVCLEIQNDGFVHRGPEFPGTLGCMSRFTKSVSLIEQGADVGSQMFADLLRKELMPVIVITPWEERAHHIRNLRKEDQTN